MALTLSFLIDWWSLVAGCASCGSVSLPRVLSCSLPLTSGVLRHWSSPLGNGKRLSLYYILQLCSNVHDLHVWIFIYNTPSRCGAHCECNYDIQCSAAAGIYLWKWLLYIVYWLVRLLFHDRPAYFGASKLSKAFNSGEHLGITLACPPFEI